MHGGEIVLCTPRRIRRVQPDDPRVEGFTRWLHTQSWSEEQKAEVREALIAKVASLGILDQIEEWPEGETHPHEVREPGLAEEVQGREVPPLNLWASWLHEYGVEGARAIARNQGYTPAG